LTILTFIYLLINKKHYYGSIFLTNKNLYYELHRPKRKRRQNVLKII